MVQLAVDMIGVCLVAGNLIGSWTGFVAARAWMWCFEGYRPDWLHGYWALVEEVVGFRQA